MNASGYAQGSENANASACGAVCIAALWRRKRAAGMQWSARQDGACVGASASAGGEAGCVFAYEGTAFVCEERVCVCDLQRHRIISSYSRRAGLTVSDSHLEGGERDLSRYLPPPALLSGGLVSLSL